MALPASAQFATQDVADGLTADDLVQELLGSGVTTTNEIFSGAAVAGGLFTEPSGILGADFHGGVVLSSGSVDFCAGPNDADGLSLQTGTPGDVDLNSLIPGYSTLDATVLEFDFVPDQSFLVFRYVFASEEYDEFVTSDFNDVFAVFLDGDRPEHNIARVAGACAGAPGQPITINNVNCGFEAMDPSAPNCPCYVSNAAGTLDTEMDGMTRVFQATADVAAGLHHMKIAIADTSDEIYDANVFIRCGSLACGTVPTRPSTWGQMKARYR